MNFKSDLFESQKDSSKVDLRLKIIAVAESTNLYAINYTYAPLLLSLSLKTNDSIIKESVISPKDSVLIMSWTDTNKELIRQKFNTSYKAKYFIGDPYNIHPDKKYLYRLPFKKNKKYRVSQGYHGKHSHHKETSRYAIDFQLEIGEPVYAAREGLVVKVVDKFKESGGIEFLHHANRIIILHNDGTTAYYVHLDYKGVLVNEGDQVIKGQHLGYSDLTGYTKGPHLHFVVRKERDIAIPIYFEGYEGQELKQGKKYKVLEK